MCHVGTILNWFLWILFSQIRKNLRNIGPTKITGYTVNVECQLSTSLSNAKGAENIKATVDFLVLT